MTNSIKFLLVLTASLFVIGCSDIQSSEKELVVKETIYTEEVAVDGYDITSYFDADNISIGNPQYTVVYKGVEWLFSSEENKQKFVASAGKYIPQFNEYCPVSLARDLKIKGKPTHYVVYKDKLYFFYSKKYAEQFVENPEKIIMQAKETFEEIEDENGNK